MLGRPKFSVEHMLSNTKKAMEVIADHRDGIPLKIFLTDKNTAADNNSAEGAGPYFVTYVKEEEVDSRPGEKALEHGHYYTNPLMATLAASPNRIIPNLIVGRHGFGEIQFERPLDLSSLSSLDELLGKVVRFQRAICHVYPEGYEEPPAGEGLNVPATVRMVGCWPPNKDDKEAVNDYVELLQVRPDTEFTSYDLETGTWEFHVSHFSSYAVGGSDFSFSIPPRVATSSTSSTSTPSTSTTPAPSPSDPSPADEFSHVLLSQTSYTNAVQYAPSQANPRLVSLVNQGYGYWTARKPIPDQILSDIDAIKLTSDEYLAVFSNRETPQARAIELIDGRVRFKEYTTPSRGSVSGNVIVQLARQDPQDIFESSMGVDIPLGPSNKQPDVMFSLVLANLPNGGAGHTFQLLGSSGMLFPVVCFEISICHESLTQLVVTDIQRYFLPGTGTRYWFGIKVFKKDPPEITRWCAGHVLRDLQNGTFQSTFTFQPGSMALGLAANADITVPVAGLQFAAPLATLLHPLAVPPGYPAQMIFDIERIRRIIIRSL